MNSSGRGRMELKCLSCLHFPSLATAAGHRLQFGLQPWVLTELGLSDWKHSLQNGNCYGWEMFNHYCYKRDAMTHHWQHFWGCYCHPWVRGAVWDCLSGFPVSGGFSLCHLALRVGRDQSSLGCPGLKPFGRAGLGDLPVLEPGWVPACSGLRMWQIHQQEGKLWTGIY